MASLAASMLAAAPATPVAATGKIAFDRPLMAEDGEITGTAIFTIGADGGGEQQLTSGPSDSQPSWAPNGQAIVFVRIVRFDAGLEPVTQLWRMNADGSGQTALTPEGFHTAPAWSPDGSKIAFAGRPESGPHGIYVMDADGTGAQLVREGAFDPAWSPDGSRIAFAEEVGGASQIFVMNADGTGVAQLTTEFRFHGSPEWSPDGAAIGYLGNLDGDQASVIGVISPDGTGDRLVHENPAGGDTSSFSWSPDGNRLAFTTYLGPGGGAFYTYRLHTISVDDTNEQELTNTRGGESNAAWQPAASPSCLGSEATIVGTAADDVLTGTAGADVIYADAGNDNVNGGGGADRICGGSGRDTLAGGDGDDILAGGPDKDTLNGGRGLDTADFSAATAPVSADLGSRKATGEGADALKVVERLVGSAFDDELFGSGGPDGLAGGGGSDLLMGFAGNDSLAGESGDDTLRGGSETDSLTGGPGIDACVDGESVASCERGGGALRLDSASGFDSIDPAISWFASSWQLHNATCVRLVTYPDASAPEGSTLVPDAAVALPTPTNGGRKYSFTIRGGLQFSPPSTETVTAATFKRSIERALHPSMQSPASAYASDIVGADAYAAGSASEITGIVANGAKLTITLNAARGDFLARMAMSFFCAVPLSTPFSEQTAPVPSAGPYYLTQSSPNLSAAAVRNPNYRGRRASHFDRIEWTFGITPANQVSRVEPGTSDYGLNTVITNERQRLHETYGPESPAAQAGRQRYFVDPAQVLWYLALNTERPAFSNETLRRAVAYALNRNQLTALHGYDGGAATDQILPPGITGYRNDNVFPLNGDLAAAQALAAQAGVTPQNPINVVMYTFNVTVGPSVAQAVQNALAPLGINVSIQTFDRVVQVEKMGTRGEPFDLGLNGWGADHNDPFNILDMLLNGARLTPTRNSNISYFNNASFNTRLDAAARLFGAVRYTTYADLDRDLSAAAPIIPYINTHRIHFFSDRIGCHALTPGLGTTALNALCLR